MREVRADLMDSQHSHSPQAWSLVMTTAEFRAFAVVCPGSPAGSGQRPRRAPGVVGGRPDCLWSVR